MKKAILLLFTIFSLKVGAQEIAQEKICICNTPENKEETIGLQQFIEKIKADNKSLNYIESVNPESLTVVVDDVYMEDFSKYTIAESCVIRKQILTKDPKSVNRENTATIIITTNRNK